MYDMPKNTPNNIVKQMMGNWCMKTLVLTSYNRAAKIWLKEEENIKQSNREQKILWERLEKKNMIIKKNLKIKEFYEMDSKMIKQAIE